MQRFFVSEFTRYSIFSISSTKSTMFSASSRWTSRPISPLTSARTPFGIERVERQRNVAAFEAEGQRHQRAFRVGIKGCAGGFKHICRGKLDKIGAKAKICTYRGQGYALEV